MGRVLSSPVNLGPPPAHSDQKETPILEKFRKLAFEGMSGKLKDPSNNKQGERIWPQSVNKNAAKEYAERKHNDRNAQSVTNPVYGMLVAGSILRYPLAAGASAKHHGMIHPRRREAVKLTARMYIVFLLRCVARRSLEPASMRNTMTMTREPAVEEMHELVEAGQAKYRIKWPRPPDLPCHL